MEENKKKNLYQKKNMTFLAFGNHTVRNLLHSPYFSFKKVILREEHRKDKELIELIRKKTDNLLIVNNQDFARYIPDKKNQGIVAFIRSYDYVALSSLLSHQ